MVSDNSENNLVLMLFANIFYRFFYKLALRNLLFIFSHRGNLNKHQEFDQRFRGESLRSVRITKPFIIMGCYCVVHCINTSGDKRRSRDEENTHLLFFSRVVVGGFSLHPLPCHHMGAYLKKRRNDDASMCLS